MVAALCWLPPQWGGGGGGGGREVEYRQVGMCQELCKRLVKE